MPKKKPKTLNDKIDLILKNQEKILEKEKKILSEEGRIEELEELELQKEDSEMDSLQQLESLEKKLKDNIQNPMKKISKRDVFKGFIGAFLGVVSHFAFSKAADIALTLSIFRATMLYVVAFLIIVIMLYYTGFRNIEKHVVLKFMPLRALILYSVSIVTVIIVNILFGKIYLPITFESMYTLVGASIILAVIGACTADLIGRSE